MNGPRARADVYHVATFQTALGWMAIRWWNGRVTRLAFGHRGAQSALRAVEARDTDVSELPPAMGATVARLTAYGEGANDDFRDIRVDNRRWTAFQRAVLERCRRIPRGQVLSYSQLAACAGSPNSARAVGNVMAHNRIPLIIPCHRVVGTKGALGGFSAPEGIRMKQRLLRLEGCVAVAPRGLQPVGR